MIDSAYCKNCKKVLSEWEIQDEECVLCRRFDIVQGYNYLYYGKGRVEVYQSNN